MSLTIEEEKKVLHTIVLMGAILLSNGAETRRVEDTMLRMGAHAGFKDFQVFVLLTGIQASVPTRASEVRAVHTFGMDLEKVDFINTLSRKFANDEVTIAEVHEALLEIDKKVPYFSARRKVFSSWLVSLTLMIAFTGNISFGNLLACSLAGILGYIILILLNKRISIHFVNEFASALVVGTIAFGCGYFFHFSGYSANDVIIGAVMPLVPGVAITNGMRDILDGNLITGPARICDALLTAGAVGVGVALTMFIF
jgi:uncharacterized membrane protein YjjP (DUF1212 family)